VSSIEADFLRLTTEADVPGMASAIIRDGRLHGYVCCGRRSAQALAPVDEHTVFEAASLSKPVFAHAVLQLVDQEHLSLDAPLGDYLSNYVPTDDRVSSITPRHVLSHRCGFRSQAHGPSPVSMSNPPALTQDYCQILFQNPLH
jgi:CubicO group peptidase (beta-lactamase class C family)